MGIRPTILPIIVFFGGMTGTILAIAMQVLTNSTNVQLPFIFLNGYAFMVSGKPFISGGKVTATIESHGKSDKVRIVKFRRRKHYKREKCHRQEYTQIKVTGIVG